MPDSAILFYVVERDPGSLFGAPVVRTRRIRGRVLAAHALATERVFAVSTDLAQMTQLATTINATLAQSQGV